MSGPDIFISYCRQDRPSARVFAQAFVEEGFSVWWDAVMHSGETFDEVIERNLRAAKAVVVIWSPRSVASRWVRAEATQADRANKLVPVKIEACDLPIIFELTHTADLEGWAGDRSDYSWESLVTDLRRLVGPAKAQEAASEVAVEAKPAPIAAVEQPPVKLDEVASVSEAKGPEAPRQDELVDALDRLAKKQVSTLLEPTETEQAQARFFKQADEYRQTEGENVHCLRRLNAPDGEALHVVGANGLQLGRTAPSDVIIFEPGVSREHCLVEVAADKLRVMDLNSTNGTYIDNKRVGRAEILPVGSVLRVGNIAFEHEVHTRAEMESMSNVIRYDVRDDRPEPRVARS